MKHFIMECDEDRGKRKIWRWNTPVPSTMGGDDEGSGTVRRDS